jgi:hypothetical protein
MVVLNRNLSEIDPNSIIDSKVVYAIFAGKIVYDAKTGHAPFIPAGAPLDCEPKVG